MSTTLVWDNLVAYSLQIGLLVGLAAFIPTAVRLRQPKARLYYWYLLLVTCLALPMLRPWRQEVVTAPVPSSAPVVSNAPVVTVRHSMPRSEMALLLLAAGAAVRLAWLAAGFWKLRRFRLHSRPLQGDPTWSVTADLRVSEAVESPVTFGYLKPVILLPGHFPELDQAKQDAILCHEILHVWRHDWVFTVGEELVRAVFWFHPGIWWLLGEIQLAREQAVDQEVVAMTSRRDEYVDALLTIAGAAQLDLAPAPLFLRKRHLKQRVVSILKEAKMSKTRLISAFALSLAMLAAACWFVTGAFPLAASPQMVMDANGVTVQVNDPLMHRSGVIYPETALKGHVEGTVTVLLKIGANGEVADASVLSGPDELRKAVLTSVLNWHFMREAANSTRQVSVIFQAPKAAPGPAIVSVQPEKGAVVGGVPGGVSGGVGGGVHSEVMGGVPGGVRSGTLGGIIGSMPVRTAPKTIKSIVVAGLGDQARADLLSRLPVHEGDAFSPDTFSLVQKTVRDFDDHLSVGMSVGPDGEATLRIAAPGANMIAPRSFVPPPGAIAVEGSVQQIKLVSQPRPAYPPLAKEARISGVVHLNALIGKDGAVKNLQVISGHPLLVQAAMEAVQQWVYQPTLLNGAPVEVFTQIDVNFTLSQ